MFNAQFAGGGAEPGSVGFVDVQGVNPLTIGGVQGADAMSPSRVGRKRVTAFSRARSAG